MEWRGDEKIIKHGYDRGVYHGRSFCFLVEICFVTEFKFIGIERKGFTILGGVIRSFLRRRDRL